MIKKDEEEGAGKVSYIAMKKEKEKVKVNWGTMN